MKLFLYNLFIIVCYSYSIEKLQMDIKDVIGKLSYSDEYLTHYINAPIGYDFFMHGNTPQYFPIVTEPEVTEPEVTEPEVTEPEVTEPEVTEPEVTEPEVTEPEVTEPEVTEPEVTEPEVTEPEVTDYHSTIRITDLCAIGESFNPLKGCVPINCSSKRACLDYQHCISRPNKICRSTQKICKKFTCYT